MNPIKLPEPSSDGISKIELQPFSEQLKPIIEESLVELQKNERNRKGTLFTPMFTVFFVLGMAMRHELSYHKVIDWIASAIRWLSLALPKKIVKDGTVTKARQYLGVDVFRLIFTKFNNKNYVLYPDFHGKNSVIFDGVTTTLPDTLSNKTMFGKPSSEKGSAAFPQLRIVALLSLQLRSILDVAYGPYLGKGTFDKL